jgi:hypothetical protein
MMSSRSRPNDTIDGAKSIRPVREFARELPFTMAITVKREN